MTTRLRLFWERVHTSYWFLPSLMLATGAGLAFGATWFDRTHDARVGSLTGVFSGGPEGARAVLGTVAASVLGVAGTTFSITIAVLSLTSSQFGPRLLRNFLKDTGNQIVLGTFIGTFLYALLVLRTVRSVDERAFVPHVAVTLGLVLAVTSVCMLVYFIQHIVGSIQAGSIIAAAGRDLCHGVQRLFPSKIGEPAEMVDLSREGGMPGPPTSIRATSSGYVQAVDGQALLRLGTREDLITELVKMPGEFLASGTALAKVFSARAPEESVCKKVNDSVTLGENPTQTQDVLFAIRQLSEIATRALSPGVNDPNTAMTCLDWLSVGLCDFAARALPSNCRRDEQGQVRVIVKAPSFEVVFDCAFDQIRRYGRSDAEVLSRLLEVIEDIASCSRTTEQRNALRRHADLALAEAAEGLTAAEAREQVAARHRKTLRTIEGGMA